MVNSQDIAEIQNNVDLISVMTYDFSNVQRPGFSSPPSWSLQSMMTLVPRDDSAEDLCKKLLLGLNFYGNDFKLPSGGGPIVGSQYVDLLKQHKPKLVWEEEGLEHKFTYSSGGSSHVVYFPTLKFISERLNSAERLTIGVAIWEIGQGLDYFFDLF
jgi:chitinase domain-containing protein 1